MQWTEQKAFRLVAPRQWRELKAPALHLNTPQALDTRPVQLQIQRELRLQKWEWALRVAVDVLNVNLPRSAYR